MQEQGIQVQCFGLSLEGLRLRYQRGAETTTLRYDAFATCALFQELSLIEGFDSDGREPVILYEDARVKPYGWCLWMEFVRTFPFGPREAQKVAEHHFAKCKHQASQPKEQGQDKLLSKDVLPPLHLYALHNYYYEHIRTRSDKHPPGTAG